VALWSALPAWSFVLWMPLLGITGVPAFASLRGSAAPGSVLLGVCAGCVRRLPHGCRVRGGGPPVCCFCGDRAPALPLPTLPVSPCALGCRSSGVIAQWHLAGWGAIGCGPGALFSGVTRCDPASGADVAAARGPAAPAWHESGQAASRSKARNAVGGQAGPRPKWAPLEDAWRAPSRGCAQLKARPACLTSPGLQAW